MLDPIITIRAPRGSDAWQEGLDYIAKPASEVTAEDVDDMDASERAFYLDWVDRHMSDHEAALHNAEPAEETMVECAASAAE